LKTGRNGFGKTRKTPLRRRSTKALAARLPFASLADRFRPAPEEEQNSEPARRRSRSAAYRRSVSEERQPNIERRESEGRIVTEWPRLGLQGLGRLTCQPSRARPEAIASGGVLWMTQSLNKVIEK